MSPSTLLYRQVHPSFVQEGRITSQVFTPTPKDYGCLSVYDGNQITARAAWRHYTSKQRFLSAGVVALTVDECFKEELQVSADPDAFPAHVLIDFIAIARNRIKRTAKRLRAIAEQRGWQYRPEASL